MQFEVTKYDVYVCSLLLLHIIFLRAAQYCQNGRELVRAVFFKEKHFPALENRLHLDSAPVKAHSYNLICFHTRYRTTHLIQLSLVGGGHHIYVTADMICGGHTVSVLKARSSKAQSWPTFRSWSLEGPLNF